MQTVSGVKVFDSFLKVTPDTRYFLRVLPSWQTTKMHTETQDASSTK